MDWDKLRIFEAVAQAGSFTHAGETLRLSQSAVSRQIGALERELNIALFHRHARGLVLTEQGEMLYRTVSDVASKLSAAEAMLTDSHARPRGPLRIAAPVGLGSGWLTPRIREFIERYPEISVSLLLTDAEIDLTLREADVAIQVMPPHHPDLVQRRLMTVHIHAYASPEYLKRYGIPKTPKDLDDHRIIVYSDDPPLPFPDITWLLRAGLSDGGAERKPVFRVNSVYGVFRAVQSGLGVAGLPDYMVQKDSNLVLVLPEFEVPSLEAYFVYPEALRNTVRLKVFRDFLLRKIADTEF